MFNAGVENQTCRSQGGPRADRTEISPRGKGKLLVHDFGRVSLSGFLIESAAGQYQADDNRRAAHNWRHAVRSRLVGLDLQVPKCHDVGGLIGRELRYREAQHPEQGDNHTDDYYWLHSFMTPRIRARLKAS